MSLTHFTDKKENPTTKQPAVCPYSDPKHAFSDLSHLVRHIELVISKKGGKTPDDIAEYERIAGKLSLPIQTLIS